ncbi:hypothetical protein IMSAGC020_01501 [Lachnospiraceae bacterium]|nr:hypothetical protein IMSAGC020_01501 [Lachnospiraceae bacterium]
MASKNKFEIVNGNVHISREEWKQIAEVTYREDYYEELTSVTWTATNGYIKNAKFGLLHRYMMQKWYGNEVFDEMTKRGWVVDHMNNNGYDCRICNLEFLPSRHNVAKGQILDVEAEEMRLHIALNIFKDFTTGLYQISIGFNDNIYFYNAETKENQLINTLYLLYDCDYKQVIYDAEEILLKYQTEKKFGLGKLNFIDYRCEFPPKIEFTERELDEIVNGDRCFIERDGEIYFVPGKNNWILSAHYEEGWKPSL